MVWYLLRTIEHPAKSRGGKAAQIFKASSQLFSHLSRLSHSLYGMLVCQEKNAQLYCLSNINLVFHKKKKKGNGRHSRLKNHLNAKCKIHSCLIPLPPLGRFRTSSPDVGKVFRKPKKKRCSVCVTELDRLIVHIGMMHC